MIAHIICCNDALEYVVIDDLEAAEEKLDKLAKEYWEINKLNIIDSFLKDYKDFRKRYYWHIHTVEAQ